MPRGSSRSSSSSSSSSPSRSTFRASPQISAPAPAPAPAALPPQAVTAERSFGQALKEGFGWGIGTSIARNIFGGNTQTVHHTTAAPAPASGPEPAILKNPEYEQCMKESFNNAETCKQYLELK